VTGQGYTGVGAADSFNLYNNTIGTVHSVTAAGAHIIGNASAKGSHTVNGYLSANGAGTSGTASGEHPYLAVKKISGTGNLGTNTVLHGILAGGDKILNVSVSVKVSGVWVSIVSHVSTQSPQLTWDDTSISFALGGGGGVYPYVILITYEP
jgi:hypothetical protein